MSSSIDLLSKSPPLQGYRFRVSTLTSAIASTVKPMDMRFAKVGGLEVEISDREVSSGGQTLYDYRFPEKVSYGNLTLERGMVVGSLMSSEFILAMTAFKFMSCNILIQILDEEGGYQAGWLFKDAWPVKWSIADLDAGDSGVLIETLEYAYRNFVPITY